jgi:hypothetical protein
MKILFKIGSKFKLIFPQNFDGYQIGLKKLVLDWFKVHVDSSPEYSQYQLRY